MSPRRPNPKKDAAARRRRPSRTAARPAGTSGGRRIRMDMGTVTSIMLNAPADALPLVGLAGLWLWNAAEDGHAAAHCVDACLNLHYALAEYGIGSRVEAVNLDLKGNGSHTLYGDENGPYYNPDGTFNGHAVLVVPEAGRFLDPTLQQYAEVPATAQATLPLMARLPAGSGLGTAWISIPRPGHEVTYRPVPEQQREAWRSPALIANDRAYRDAAANLAANVFDLLRSEPFRDMTAASPYPRLRLLLDVLGDAESITDGNGYRFRHPRTGQEVHLADIH